IRDPFRFGPTPTAPPVHHVATATVSAPPRSAQPVLTSIVFDNDPQATIRYQDHDYSVRVNSLFAEFRVIGIARDHVTLDRAGETVALKLRPKGECHVSFRRRFPRPAPAVAALALAPALLAAAMGVAPPPCGAAPTPDMQKPVTLDAEDAPLPNVLKILAEKGGLNVITGVGVSSGRITIHMKDVPIDQAVNLVVRAAGLGYERIGNSVLIADPRALKEETGLSSYV